MTQDLYKTGMDQNQYSNVSTATDTEKRNPRPHCSDAALAADQHIRGHALKAYSKNRQQEISDDQIVEYLPMVNRIVNNVVSSVAGALSKDDLVSAGTIGLVKAAKDYDSSKNADFKTYAYIRVRGAVIDELRKWSFTPSEISRQAETVQMLAIEMQEELGTTPSDEELAERAGITVEKLQKIYEGNRNKNFLSIHGVSDEAPSIGMSLISQREDKPESRLEKQEIVEILSESIQDLPENARRVVILYYHQQLTMKEIAEVLEITESRVSQLHASAIFKLSVKMSKYDDTGKD